MQGSFQMHVQRKNIQVQSLPSFLLRVLIRNLITYQQYPAPSWMDLQLCDLIPTFHPFHNTHKDRLLCLRRYRLSRHFLQNEFSIKVLLFLSYYTQFTRNTGIDVVTFFCGDTRKYVFCLACCKAWVHMPSPPRQNGNTKFAHRLHLIQSVVLALRLPCCSNIH